MVKELPSPSLTRNVWAAKLLATLPSPGSVVFTTPMIPSRTKPSNAWVEETRGRGRQGGRVPGETPLAPGPIVSVKPIFQGAPGITGSRLTVRNGPTGAGILMGRRSLFSVACDCAGARRGDDITVGQAYRGASVGAVGAGWGVSAGCVVAAFGGAGAEAFRLWWPCDPGSTGRRHQVSRRTVAAPPVVKEENRK